jgi:hypothetical protein
MDFEFDGAFGASASQTSAGSLIIVSRKFQRGFNLMIVESVDFRGKSHTLLRNAILRAKSLEALDAIALRENLSSEWGSRISSHILYVLDREKGVSDDVVADTAWRYSILTSWGEASSARELSRHLKTPVHTIHSRLRLARDRGLIPSPGTGSRRGK